MFFLIADIQGGDIKKEPPPVSMYSKMSFFSSKMKMHSANKLKLCVTVFHNVCDSFRASSKIFISVNSNFTGENHTSRGGEGERGYTCAIEGVRGA